MPSSQPSPQEAAQELMNRRLARRSFTEFSRQALEPQGFAPAAHHRLLISELEAIARGDNDRLLIMMPPGSAKSTYASHLFPPWFMHHRPGSSIIGASHTAELAEEFSGKVQGFIRDNARTLGFDLATDAKSRWSATNGSRYLAAGVGGPIAGFRADLAIIDDPVKNRENADSEAFRNRTWNWFKADLRTRMRPRSPILCIATRWHEDDLMGRIIQDQGNRWRQLRLPAIAMDDDPMGREPGEMLWSDDAYGYAAEVQRVREESGEDRDWWSLYQQEPRPLSGGLFKVDNLHAMDAEPKGRCIRAWDLASTAKTGTRDPDWTVGLKLVRTADNGFCIADVVRVRGGPEEVERIITATATRDGKSVPISIPQDPGQAGKSQVAYLGKKLLGYRVDSSPETGSKATRAQPVASQCNIGNVSMVRAPWNRLLLDELAAFPSGNKDDQVDALSRAFAGLVGSAYDSSMKWVG